ncbi:glycosyltransferase family 2 protein [Cryomorpha ignava]|uniref:Glycosyltransferase family 2 protein n=1 Tax=Cryomorpha ignava TaxID=101383 RepID=A0A7K3WPE1_9FLAO|nr:glycosyltransferase family 2 protein [Cryomorpha ignava]NEN23406.1 glycosyltransferase family 2 protein [Cryomorpha ignava]
MIDKPLISVVSPVYRAEGIVAELVSRTKKALSEITEEYEILLVNDGSPDNSWEEIRAEANLDQRVKGINLSRNFGQHQALLCALQLSKGDYVVAMDCDLQDNPEFIPELFLEIQKGFDLVYTSKKRIGHSRNKNVFAFLFNKVFNYLIDSPQQASSSDVGTYSILSRKVVDAFCQVNDYERHYLMTLRWLGFDSSTITISHNKRKTGRSSYTFGKLLLHAINGITYQSDKLLRLNITVGFIIATVAFLAGLIIIILYFTQGFLSGWTSMIVTLFFMLGVLLISVGILGIYIGKIFDQVKDRPKFIIKEITNQ